MTSYDQDIFRKKIFSKDPDQIDEGMALLKLADIQTIEDIFTEIGWEMLTEDSWWPRMRKHSYLTLYLLGLMHEFDVEWVVALKELEICDDDLMRLPDILGNLTGLTYLLIECGCTSLPDSLEQITNLTLSIAGSFVMNNIPANLVGVSLNKEQWEKFEYQICTMTSLRHLTLGENELTQLPESISNLKHLTSLELWYNPALQIPDWMKNLTNLRSLQLQSNEYTKIPESLYNLTQLKHLDLDGNPIPPSEKSRLLSKLPSCKIIF